MILITFFFCSFFTGDGNFIKIRLNGISYGHSKNIKAMCFGSDRGMCHLAWLYKHKKEVVGGTKKHYGKVS